MNLRRLLVATMCVWAIGLVSTARADMLGGHHDDGPAPSSDQVDQRNKQVLIIGGVAIAVLVGAAIIVISIRRKK